MTDNQYLGKICSKHPELNGLRQRCDNHCIQCKRIRAKKYRSNLSVHMRLMTNAAKRNRERYAKGITRSSSGAPVHSNHRDFIGSACELFVAVELLTAGLTVFRSFRQQGPHDLCVDIDDRIRTVQVKTGIVNTNTNQIYLHGNRSEIKSELIAVVDLIGRRIRWKSNTSEPVPEILRHDSTAWGGQPSRDPQILLESA